MNTDQTTSAPGNFTIAPNTWGDKKFKLKNKFGHLNDDDLHFENGKEAGNDRPPVCEAEQERGGNARIDQRIIALAPPPSTRS